MPRQLLLPLKNVDTYQYNCATSLLFERRLFKLNGED